MGRRSYLRGTVLAGALLGAGVGFGSSGVNGLVQPAYAYTSEGTEIIRSTESIAVTTEETEPNDDQESATSVDVNRGAEGSLTADEHDWFATKVDADQQLTIAFERVSGSGNAAVAVYKTDGTFADLLVEGTAPNELTVTPDAAGTMFVQVIDLNDGAGSYRLLVHDSTYQEPTPTPTSTPTPSPTPEPCDSTTTFAPNATGRIVAEAEHFTAQHATAERQWYRVSEGSEPDVSPDPDGSHASTASNGEYIEILPDTRVTHDDPLESGVNFDDYPTDGDPMAIVDYPVEFDQPGRYYVWVRGLRTGSEDNGVHVGVDGTWERSGARIQWCTPHGEWHWRSRLRTSSNHCGDPDVRAYIDVDTAGTHTVQFAMREDGFEMDKFVLTRDESYQPSGLGEAESLKSACEISTPTPTPTPGPAPAPTPSGHVWLEAESARDGANFDPFEIRTDAAAAGGEYIVTPDQGRDNYDGPPAAGHAEYTFDLAADDDYVLWGRTRGQSNGNTFYVGVDGSPDTEWHVELGDEWRWSKLPLSPTLSAGTHKLTIAYREDGTALDKLLVTDDTGFTPSGTGGDTTTATPTPEPTPTATATPTPEPTPTPDPRQPAYTDHDVSRIEAEAYDEGGEGIAYHDVDGQNSGGAYRDEGVDIQPTTDDDGYNVGWIEDGEWIEYTVDLAAGTYELRARVASIHDGTKLRAILDGEVIGTFDVPNTGDWQNWQTVTLTGLDISGGRVLRLEALTNGAEYGFNINWVGFARTDTSTATPTPTPTSTATPTPSPDGPRVSGEMKEWHRVTLAFEGPSTDERADPNPFLQYRLNVTFTGPSGQEYVVPGFYATDGNGGESGNVWKARFAPDEAGTWSYRASFRTGTDVAVSLDPTAGSATSFDGASGTFSVAESDKSGRDFRAYGTLKNRGDHYLQFPDGTRWLKCGPDIPENFMGYTGFTNQPNAAHDYAAHRDDWESGDPDWNSGDGKGIVGAINYIASTGSNCVYFLPMNVGGDGNDTWPFVDMDAKTRYDADKLRQWETVFTHAQSKGVFLHVVLAETESANENYFDDGNLGVERKLFFRELTARFGHQPGLQWNLGEENDFTTTQHERFSAYLHDVDPYDHPVAVHTRDGDESVYDSLLGNDDIEMTSFQGAWDWKGDTLANVVQKWRRQSANAGAPWVVSLDEPYGVENDHDDRDRGLPHGRVRQMWPTFMSGGGGFEWYVMQDGGGHSLDQDIDDLRDIAPALEWSGYLLDFFDRIPYWQMEVVHGQVSGGDGYMLEDSGRTYAVYLPDGDEVSLDLSAGEYQLTWFDPGSGSETDGGTISGGDSTALGRPPFDGDAAALLQG